MAERTVSLSIGVRVEHRTKTGVHALEVWMENDDTVYDLTNELKRITGLPLVDLKFLHTPGGAQPDYTSVADPRAKLTEMRGGHFVVP